jgi:hypothetical protein
MYPAKSVREDNAEQDCKAMTVSGLKYVCDREQVYRLEEDVIRLSQKRLPADASVRLSISTPRTTRLKAVPKTGCLMASERPFSTTMRVFRLLAVGFIYFASSWAHPVRMAIPGQLFGKAY